MNDTAPGEFDAAGDRSIKMAGELVREMIESGGQEATIARLRKRFPSMTRELVLLMLEVGEGKRRPDDEAVLKAAAKCVALHVRNN